jgi:hypothetical protein
MRALCALSIIAGSLWLIGCGAKPSVVAQENDRLRAKVLELEGRVKGLESRNDELETQLEQSRAAPTSVPTEIAENTPHVTGISINRLSHARDANGDGRMDTIVLYIQPADGLGRFLQIVGTVSVHVAILPAAAQARTIGTKLFSPREVRDGYRSAFTGQYYSFELPIEPLPAAKPAPIPPPPSAGDSPPVSGAVQPAATAPANRPAAIASTQCTVRVEYVDGYTGRSFSAERVIDLQ